MSYDIGYRKPPKDKQFKKGASGNPKGRPKGSKNFVTLLDQELSRSIVVTENGKKKKLTKQEAMIKRLVAAGLSGDLKTLMAIFEMKRRTGGLDAAGEPASLLPDNYQSILNDYVAARSDAEASNRSRAEESS